MSLLWGVAISIKNAQRRTIVQAYRSTAVASYSIPAATEGAVALGRSSNGEVCIMLAFRHPLITTSFPELFLQTNSTL